MKTFEIAVPSAVREDLRQRLVRSRRPPALVTGWSGGTDTEYLASLVGERFRLA